MQITDVSFARRGLKLLCSCHLIAVPVLALSLSGRGYCDGNVTLCQGRTSDIQSAVRSQFDVRSPRVAAGATT